MWFGLNILLMILANVFIWVLITLPQDLFVLVDKFFV